MKSFLVLLISFFTLTNSASEVVKEDQFKFGKTWRWLYSEKDTNGNWKPYFLEQYRVIAKQGKQINIEMSSRSTDSSGPLLAHHRFQIDFADCERMNSGMLHNSLTVKFWSKQNGIWQLVSNQHVGLVFTEKFNCSPKELNSHDEIILDGMRYALFQNRNNVGEFFSWYFSNHTHSGVVGRKLFEPTGDYKFEFLDAN